MQHDGSENPTFMQKMEPVLKSSFLVEELFRLTTGQLLGLLPKMVSITQGNGISTRRIWGDLGRVAKSLRFPLSEKGQLGADINHDAVCALANASRFAKNNDWEKAHEFFSRGIMFLRISLELYLELIDGLKKHPNTSFEWTKPTQFKAGVHTPPPARA